MKKISLCITIAFIGLLLASCGKKNVEERIGEEPVFGGKVSDGIPAPAFSTPPISIPRTKMTLREDDPTLGDSGAPVTVVMFSDMECGFCRAFFEQKFAKLKTDYIETGKVYFIHRDFPNYQLHKNALPAALALECANESGKFWEMHEKLLENVMYWNVDNTKPVLTSFGEGLGVKKLSACMENDDTLKQVGTDYYEGQQLKIRGTPTFFVNGITVIGDKNLFVTIDQELDALLR